MKKILFSIVLCCAPVAIVAGCGGGGGGNGGGPGVPTATPTSINQNTVTVQLRDEQSGIVNGIVTLAGRRQATVSGQTTFTGIALGNQSVSAEVNGIATSQNFTANQGETTVTVVISANVTPTATGTAPPPPF